MRRGREAAAARRSGAGEQPARERVTSGHFDALSPGLALASPVRQIAAIGRPGHTGIAFGTGRAALRAPGRQGRDLRRGTECPLMTGSTHARSRRLVVAVAAATTVIATALGASGAAPAAPIGPAAFGMHFLGMGSRPYPGLSFGSARLWDMGVTWADLQPTPTDPIAGTNPAVRRLDAIVHGFQARHVRPLIVLGMTPAWAVDPNCHPPAKWPLQTCGPVVVGGQSPAWSSYVLSLALRYSDVDFEVWNEPNLRNGWNDSITKLATLQHLAATAIHDAGTGDVVVSPSVAVTSGSPLSWLSAFLRAPGGRDFDVFGLHLYPSDRSARGGYGPEWSIGMLHRVRAVLRRHGVRAPTWDTEMNVGRYPYRHSSSRAFAGLLGAAMVARTYLLQLARGVDRVYWYAADDRSWGGTWLEPANLRGVTAAGAAFRVLRRMLVGARPLGCLSQGRVTNARYTCRFHLRTGQSMWATWCTGRARRLSVPAGTRRLMTVTGVTYRVRSRTRITIGAAPTYVIGSLPTR